MKNKFLLQISILIAIFFSQNAKVRAQWVTIPDPNFVLFLQENYPTCMNGDQMDTTCSEIVNANDLTCAYREIIELDGIQYFDSLKFLYCNSNLLSSLPELKQSLIHLDVNNNYLTSLPELPVSLTTLICDFNQLINLPTFHQYFNFLSCGFNNLLSLPPLPQSLTVLWCGDNQLFALPEIPNLLVYLTCSNNQLFSIPTLPQTLTHLYCQGNQITSLPSLPESLISLDCSYNQITSIPSLPTMLEDLSCEYNELTTLPSLSLLNSLGYIDCTFNQILCFPAFQESTYTLFIDNNPFTCLSNHTSNMGFDLLAYPLCEEGDFINNPNNCESAKGITGNIYKDVNADCINNASDPPSQNIPVQLFDESDNLITTYYSSIDGSYNFYQFSGTYKVAIDTLNKPYTVSCSEIGIDSTVVLDENNTFIDSVSFAIECKPGFDLKVQSIAQTGWVFPGLQHQVNVVAGDILSFYNLNCTNGSGGTVQINVTGSVTYDGVALGALVPDAIIGNSFTYNIADFGTLSSNSFGLLFLTDTTAQAEETVCITASITPDEIDNDTTNNTLTYCYLVTNSYDPNEKEVYPTSVLPNYDGYFTYTIHFQNTGTAPAVNIKVQDTLSTYLDLSTFEITSYSHPNNTTITGNLISFKFPNIWLPDSTSNLEGSKGFIQYRIKPFPSLPVGTQITNTAYIYFDYNDPIQTNITTSNFEIINGIKAYSKGKVSIYPNPNNGMFHVNLLEKNQNEKTLELTNLLGEKVWIQKTKSNSTTIDINHLPKGIYILNITDINSHFTERIIKN